jgi:hypothetical protein
VARALVVLGTGVFFALLAILRVAIVRNKKRPIDEGKKGQETPGDKPNIDIVVLDAFDLGQKGKSVEWLKKQMCLIAYRGSYE